MYIGLKTQLFWVLVLTFLTGVACAQGVKDQKVLRDATRAWEKQEQWEGPKGQSVQWSMKDNSRSYSRQLDGVFFLSNRKFSQDELSEEYVSIRNPNYAADLKKNPNSWSIVGIAHSNEKTYAAYSNEAWAPWIAQLRIPGQGGLSGLVGSKQLVPKSITQEGDLYHFTFVIDESRKDSKLSLVEVDASPSTGWFPQRLRWVRKNGTDNTFKSSGLVLCDGFYVPTQFELQESDGTGFVQSVKISAPTNLDHKQCYLEFYGLGEVELPQRPETQIGWSEIVLFSIVFATVGSIAFFVLRTRRS